MTIKTNKVDQTSKRPHFFSTQFAFIENILIYAFDSSGRPIYVKTDDPGHDFSDVCSCTTCLSTEVDDGPSPPKRRRSRKRSHQKLHRVKLHKAFENREPFVGLLGEPSSKFDY